MSLLSRFLRRHVIADDPNPGPSTLDLLDLERSMADHPAGKRRPAVRPAPESLEEALSEDDLLAVARGAGVIREPHVDPIATAAMRHYRETNDLDGALAIFAGRDAS